MLQVTLDGSEKAVTCYVHQDYLCNTSGEVMHTSFLPLSRRQLCLVYQAAEPFLAAPWLWRVLVGNVSCPAVSSLGDWNT